MRLIIVEMADVEGIGAILDAVDVENEKRPAAEKLDLKVVKGPPQNRMYLHGQGQAEGGGTFRHVQHPDLRADYVLANPSFNDSDWFRKDDDVRWQFGVPPKGNARRAPGRPSHHIGSTIRGTASAATHLA